MGGRSVLSHFLILSSNAATSIRSGGSGYLNNKHGQTRLGATNFRCYYSGVSVSQPDSTKSTLIASEPKGLVKHEGDLYLVVLNGELIKLTRELLRSEDRYVTTRFMIQRFVASKKKWVKVESLGDNALFLCKNTSFSLRASEHPGCIPNAIYFTDCTIKQNQQYGSDMGVYKLSDQSVKPLYPIGSGFTLPPPVFVTRLDMFRDANIPILFSGRLSLGDDNDDVNPAPRSIQDTSPNPDTSSIQDTSSNLDSGDGRVDTYRV